MTAKRTAAFSMLLVFALAVAPAWAQPTAASGRLELAAGGLWVGRTTLTGGDAHETTATGGTFRLFSTSSSLASMAGFEARVGYSVTRRLQVEAAASLVRPELRVTVGDDAESAAAVTATERIQQFTFGGDVLWYVAAGGRIAPFVEAGGSYMRLLHDGKSLAETGRAYEAGLGFKYALHASAGGVKAIGLRVDARAVARSKAVIFDKLRVSPAAGVSIYLRF
jgi:outer membrane protein with beta-barrel domain